MDKEKLLIAEHKAHGIHLLYPELYKFPFNSAEAAHKLGVKVFVEDTSLYNWYDYDLEAKRIYINADLSRKQMRYNIAFALGHILMEHKALHSNIEQYTAEANNFAIQLIAPKEVVMNRINSGEDFDDLVKYFDVTESVIAFRLEILGIIGDSWRS